MQTYHSVTSRYSECYLDYAKGPEILDPGVRVQDFFCHWDLYEIHLLPTETMIKP